MGFSLRRFFQSGRFWEISGDRVGHFFKTGHGGAFWGMLRLWRTQPLGAVETTSPDRASSCMLVQLHQTANLPKSSGPARAICTLAPSRASSPSTSTGGAARRGDRSRSAQIHICKKALENDETIFEIRRFLLRGALRAGTAPRGGDREEHTRALSGFHCGFNQYHFGDADKNSWRSKVVP